MVDNGEGTGASTPAGASEHATRISEGRGIAVLVWVYVGLIAATAVSLVALSTFAPAQATSAAWGHTVIVVIFAVLLPLRLRSARHGKPGSLRALAMIASALLVVNVVEASIPGFLPGWMRIEMLVVAALMAVLVVRAVRSLRAR